MLDVVQFLCTCTLVITGFPGTRGCLVVVATFLVSTRFAVGNVLLECVLVAILLVEGVEVLIAVIALTVGCRQVTLLALSIAAVRFVVSSLV